MPTLHAAPLRQRLPVSRQLLLSWQGPMLSSGGREGCSESSSEPWRALYRQIVASQGFGRVCRGQDSVAEVERSFRCDKAQSAHLPEPVFATENADCILSIGTDFRRTACTSGQMRSVPDLPMSCSSQIRHSVLFDRAATRPLMLDTFA